MIVLLLMIDMQLISLVIYAPFFFNDTTTTEIYTLSLHDALPIYDPADSWKRFEIVYTLRQLRVVLTKAANLTGDLKEDRKSTRLNSSHTVISYAVFCLKKKNSG